MRRDVARSWSGQKPRIAQLLRLNGKSAPQEFKRADWGPLLTTALTQAPFSATNLSLGAKDLWRSLESPRSPLLLESVLIHSHIDPCEIELHVRANGGVADSANVDPRRLRALEFALGCNEEAKRHPHSEIAALVHNFDSAVAAVAAGQLRLLRGATPEHPATLACEVGRASFIKWADSVGLPRVPLVLSARLNEPMMWIPAIGANRFGLLESKHLQAFGQLLDLCNQLYMVDPDAFRELRAKDLVPFFERLAAHGIPVGDRCIGEMVRIIVPGGTKLGRRSLRSRLEAVLATLI